MQTNPPTSSVISRIERELREIWAEPSSPNEAPKSRACTMNIVVLVGSRELSDRYTPVIDEVTGSIPARAILVAIDPESPISVMDADATAVCSLEGSRSVCSERVRLYASGNICARVGSAVEALLVPELPTALVWLGPLHVDDPIFEALAGSASRIVLDTEYTSLASLLHLTNWARESADRAHVADLAWTRLAPWQEMCARFFDEPRLRDHAARMTRVTLKQASPPRTRLGGEGALLLGWLGTRLGWKVSRLGGALRWRRADGENVAVQLGTVPIPGGVAPQVLAEVTLESDLGGVTVRGTVERDLGSGTSPAAPDADVMVWRMQVGNAAPIEQRVRLGANTAAKWLERTLHRPSHDPALVESVVFAEQVVQDGIVCP
jgi:glucose-6-phosphate dehydrogenase assembly protein OpcA